MADKRRALVALGGPSRYALRPRKGPSTHMIGQDQKPRAQALPSKGGDVSRRVKKQKVRQGRTARSDQDAPMPGALPTAIATGPEDEEMSDDATEAENEQGRPQRHDNVGQDDEMSGAAPEAEKEETQPGIPSKTGQSDLAVTNVNLGGGAGGTMQTRKRKRSARGMVRTEILRPERVERLQVDAACADIVFGMVRNLASGRFDKYHLYTLQFLAAAGNNITTDELKEELPKLTKEVLKDPIDDLRKMDPAEGSNKVFVQFPIDGADEERARCWEQWCKFFTGLDQAMKVLDMRRHPTYDPADHQIQGNLQGLDREESNALVNDTFSPRAEAYNRDVSICKDITDEEAKWAHHLLHRALKVIYSENSAIKLEDLATAREASSQQAAHESSEMSDLKSEIRQLREEIEIKGCEIKELQEAGEEQEPQLQLLSERLEEATEESDRLRVDLEKAKNDLQKAAVLEKELKGKMDTCEIRSKMKIDELTTLGAEATSNKIEMKKLTQDLERSKNLLKEKQDALTKKEMDYNDLECKLHQMEAEVETKNNEMKGKDRELSQLRADIEDRERRKVRRIERLYEEEKKGTEELGRKLNEESEKRRDLALRLQRLERENREVNESKERLELEGAQRVQELESANDRLQTQLKEAQDQSHEARTSRMKIEEKNRDLEAEIRLKTNKIENQRKEIEHREEIIEGCRKTEDKLRNEIEECKGARRRDAEERSGRVGQREDELRERIKELRAKEDELLQKKDELNKKHDEVKLKDEELRRTRKELEEKSGEVEQQREQLRKIESELGQKKDELSQRDSELSRQKKEIEEKDNEIRHKREEDGKKEYDISQQKHELAKKDDELARQRRELKEKDDELGKRKEEIEQKKTELSQKNAELEEKEDELRQKKGALEQKEKMGRHQTGIIEGLEQRLQDLTATTAEAAQHSNARAQEPESGAEHLSRELAGSKESVADLRADLAQAQRTIAERDKWAEARKKEIQALENEKSRLEGQIKKNFEEQGQREKDLDPLRVQLLGVLARTEMSQADSDLTSHRPNDLPPLLRRAIQNLETQMDRIRDLEKKMAGEKERWSQERMGLESTIIDGAAAKDNTGRLLEEEARNTRSQMRSLEESLKEAIEKSQHLSEEVQALKAQISDKIRQLEIAERDGTKEKEDHEEALQRAQELSESRMKTLQEHHEAALQELREKLETETGKKNPAQREDLGLQESQVDELLAQIEHFKEATRTFDRAHDILRTARCHKKQRNTFGTIDKDLSEANESLVKGWIELLETESNIKKIKMQVKERPRGENDGSNCGLETKGGHVSDKVRDETERRTHQLGTGRQSIRRQSIGSSDTGKGAPRSNDARQNEGPRQNRETTSTTPSSEGDPTRRMEIETDTENQFIPSQLFQNSRPVRKLVADAEKANRSQEIIRLSGRGHKPSQIQIGRDVELIDTAREVKIENGADIAMMNTLLAIDENVKKILQDPSKGPFALHGPEHRDVVDISSATGSTDDEQLEAFSHSTMGTAKNRNGDHDILRSEGHGRAHSKPRSVVNDDREYVNSRAKGDRKSPRSSSCVGQKRKTKSTERRKRSSTEEEGSDAGGRPHPKRRRHRKETSSQQGSQPRKRASRRQGDEARKYEIRITTEAEDERFLVQTVEKSDASKTYRVKLQNKSTKSMHSIPLLQLLAIGTEDTAETNTRRLRRFLRDHDIVLHDALAVSEIKPVTDGARSFKVDFKKDHAIKERRVCANTLFSWGYYIAQKVGGDFAEKFKEKQSECIRKGLERMGLVGDGEG